MSKEIILKEFDNEFTNSPINFSFIREEVRQSFSKAIDQTKMETREETIREVEEEVINKIDSDFLWKLKYSEISINDVFEEIRSIFNKLK